MVCDQSGLGSIARGNYAANGSVVSGDVLLSPAKIRGVRGNHYESTGQEPQRSGTIAMRSQGSSIDLIAGSVAAEDESVD